MRKFYIFSMLLATIVACNKNSIDPENSPIEKPEEPAPVVKMITETVTGGTESRTKATIADSDASFSWSAGDNIAVHVSNGKYVFTSDTGASGASTAAASASFTVVYPDGCSRDAFAVYPSNIVIADAENYGQSGKSLDVTLPSSYTLAEVSGETSPCPMIATNAPESGWSFCQICGMLRLTVKSIPADATGLVIQFPGRKVNGAFSIASPVTPGTSIITNDAPGNGEDHITVTFDAGTSTEITFNIPLPTGKYEDVYITPVGSETKVAAVRHIKAASYNASRARAKKLTATLVAFSVSATKKVIFAPGNLHATYNSSAQTWMWAFAAHQYDYIGNKGGNKMITTTTKESTAPYAILSNDGTVDLFGRSTGDTYFGIATTSENTYYSNSFKDWGNNIIGSYGADDWFTLSVAEWRYVTGRNDCRQTGGTVAGVSNALGTRAVVNGVKGFIVFPDNYSGLTPSGTSWVAGSIQDGSYKNSLKGWEEGTVATITTTAAWEALESEGCVFLPSAGARVGSNVYFDFSSQTGWGCYWASDYTGNGRVLRFNSDGYDPLQGWNAFYAESVRLVRAL